MMRVVCIYDIATAAFGRPAFVAAVGAALRSFTDEINRADRDNMMYGHPEDFQLFDLGEFNEEIGVFNLLDKPRLICRGSDVMSKLNQERPNASIS